MSTGFVFANLLVTWTKRLVVIRRIDRTELPHLTISFENDSGDIDLHLNYEKAKSRSEQYTPLFQFPKAQAEQLFESLSPHFEQEVRVLLSRAQTVTPQWLTRRRYVIAIMNEQKLQSSILQAVLKK